MLNDKSQYQPRNIYRGLAQDRVLTPWGIAAWLLIIDVILILFAAWRIAR